MIDNDPGLLTPLQEDIESMLTYSDGQPFAINVDYLFDADNFDFDCFYLKQSSDYELRGGGCSKERGFICDWQSKKQNTITKFH